MKNVWNACLLAAAMTMGQAAIADEIVDAVAGQAVGTAEAMATQAATDAAAKVSEATANSAVQVTPTGDQVVTVNSGNQVVDAAANFAVKCTEKAAAMKTCDSMGGFKAIGCRKMAEVRYKGVECPIQ